MAKNEQSKNKNLRYYAEVFVDKSILDIIYSEN